MKKNRVSRRPLPRVLTLTLALTLASAAALTAAGCGKNEGRSTSPGPTTSAPQDAREGGSPCAKGDKKWHASSAAQTCDASNPCPPQECLCSGTKVTGPNLKCVDGKCSDQGLTPCSKVCASTDVNERPPATPPAKK